MVTRRGPWLRAREGHGGQDGDAGARPSSRARVLAEPRDGGREAALAVMKAEPAHRPGDMARACTREKLATAWGIRA